MIRFFLLLSVLMTATTSHGADSGPDESGPATNVIGSQEAPNVLNVVPWKSRDVKLEKTDPSSALLNRVLEPLDQDVLMREIQYHELLSQQPDSDDMFLE